MFGNIKSLFIKIKINIDISLKICFEVAMIFQWFHSIECLRYRTFNLYKITAIQSLKHEKTDINPIQCT